MAMSAVCLSSCRESVSVSTKSTPPAKLTKTVTLPPLTHLQPGASGKGKKSGEKLKTKKKKDPSTKYSARGDTVKIECPAAVSKLLTQKSSHQSLVSDQHSGDLSTTSGSGRHEREANFLKRVGQIAKEERANKLRW